MKKQNCALDPTAVDCRRKSHPQIRFTTTNDNVDKIKNNNPLNMLNRRQPIFTVNADKVKHLLHNIKIPNVSHKQVSDFHSSIDTYSLNNSGQLQDLKFDYEKMNNKGHNGHRYINYLKALYDGIVASQPNVVNEIVDNVLRQQMMHIHASQIFSAERYIPNASEEMINIADIVQDQIERMAQGLYDEHFIVHPYMSNNQAVVLFNKESKIVHIAFHGASSHIDTIDADTADVKAAIWGKEKGRTSFSNAEDIYLDVSNMFGPEWEIKVLGYSLGGTKAIHVGEKFNVESVTFNPFLSPLQKPLLSEETNLAKQSIHRIINDWTTIGAAYLPKGTNRFIKHYRPSENPINFWHDPYGHSIMPHKIEQFPFETVVDTVMKKPNLFKQVAKVGGHLLEGLMVGIAINDAVTMAKRGASDESYDQMLDADLNPVNLLGYNMSPDTMDEGKSFDSLPFYMRWMTSDKTERNLRKREAAKHFRDVYGNENHQSRHWKDIHEDYHTKTDGFHTDKVEDAVDGTYVDPKTGRIWYDSESDAGVAMFKRSAARKQAGKSSRFRRDMIRNAASFAVNTIADHPVVQNNAVNRNAVVNTVTDTIRNYAPQLNTALNHMFVHEEDDF